MVAGVKGVKYVVTERNLTTGLQAVNIQCKYIHDLLLNCTLGTYRISLTNVTIVKANKQTNK